MVLQDRLEASGRATWVGVGADGTAGVAGVGLVTAGVSRLVGLGRAGVVGVRLVSLSLCCAVGVAVDVFGV